MKPLWEPLKVNSPWYLWSKVKQWDYSRGSVSPRPLRSLMKFQTSQVWTGRYSPISHRAQFDVDRTLLETRQSLGFLLETSNRSSLSVRQGCAVESCARQSGRVCLLLVHTARLNVCDQKVSVLFSVPNVLVFHLNVSLLTHMTPLEKMFKDGRVETSCCKTIHFSDILRLAVLYRWRACWPLEQVRLLVMKYRQSSL